MRPDPLTAGHVHLLRQVVLSEHPIARRIAPGRCVPDGAGVALALLLTAAAGVCLAAIVWACWPVLRAVAVEIARVFWVVLP